MEQGNIFNNDCGGRSMVFDVMIREGFTEHGKMILKVHRVHDSKLSSFLREQQDTGKYVYGVIPLFKNRKER